jgi:hypothetical protein
MVGAARIFTADAVAGMSKAEAVRVMQRYESSLANSSHQVVPAQPDDIASRSYGVDGPDASTSAAGVAGGASAGGVSGAMPWSRLVGGVGGGGGSPAPGGLVGSVPVPEAGVLAAERAALSELAAGRPGGPSGFFPPMGARGAQDERERRHRTRLPNVDNGLFRLDQRSSTPVIGAETDGEYDGGL